VSIHTTEIGQRDGGYEFRASDGTRALIILTVHTEYDYEGFAERTIDPALAEVFPCVWSAWGMPIYAPQALLYGECAAWLNKYHDDLGQVAADISHAEAERRDEDMQERR